MPNEIVTNHFEVREKLAGKDGGAVNAEVERQLPTTYRNWLQALHKSLSEHLEGDLLEAFLLYEEERNTVEAQRNAEFYNAGHRAGAVVGARDKLTSNREAATKL